MAPKRLRLLLAAGIVSLSAFSLPAVPALADGYMGAPFSADAWFGTEGEMELRYRMYVGSKGYRLESVNPSDGPDIIIAQFAVPQFVYVDTDTGNVNFFPMGEDDWGRFHGIACADFEYRKRLGDDEVEGRKTEVWQCIGAAQSRSDMKIWWDPALKYRVRADEQGYITELRNIRPGEPDPSLFQTPSASH